MNSSGFEHVYVLQDLDMPDAPRILELEGIVNDPEAFIKDFGSTEEYEMDKVFWNVSSMFSEL